MKTLASVPYDYELLVDEHGAHFLDVCCGGVAMYVHREPLTPDEAATPAAIERIARQIQQHGRR